MEDRQPSELLSFSAYPVPVTVRLDARMRPTIYRLLKKWVVAPVPDETLAPQLECVANESDRITICGQWVGQTYTLADPIDAVCGFIAEALKVQANEAIGCFCLHAAATIMSDRAVVFPSGYRTGKSTLVAVLAARGRTILADDAVFISADNGSAVSPGIAPRLRLPLSSALARRTTELIDETMQLKGQRYGYLTLPVEDAMANGQHAHIGAFVFPNRRPSGPAFFDEISKADALARLIWQNFARRAPAGRILSCLSSLIVSRPTLMLNYSEAEDAADLLQSRFSNWPTEIAALPDANCLADEIPATDLPRWRAKPNLVERHLDTGHFIADEDSGRIYQRKCRHANGNRFSRD